MSISQNYPTISPSLSLDFANTKKLDPRITFSRPTTGAYYDGRSVALAEQNLFTNSEDFSLWTPTGAVRTYNTTTAPNGTITADTISDGDTTTVHRVFLSPALIANQSYTASFFVKNIDRQYVNIFVCGNVDNYFVATYDLIGATVTKTGVLGTGFSHTSSSITAVGNDWYRLVVTGVVGSNVSSQIVGISLSSTGTPTYDGRGNQNYLGTNASVYLWGAQLEQR